MTTTRGSLLDIPAWDQNGDPLPDGQQDPYHATDCGEECAAMRIWYRTGIELPAGVLRTNLPTARPDGRTSTADLVYLLRLFGLRPWGGSLAAYILLQNLAAATSLGTPPIVLGNWLSPNVLHWLLVVHADTAGATVNDPWGGRRYTLPANLLLTRYAGECIL